MSDNTATLAALGRILGELRSELKDDIAAVDIKTDASAMKGAVSILMAQQLALIDGLCDSILLKQAVLVNADDQPAVDPILVGLLS